MATSFLVIPPIALWRNASNVTFAIRNRDVVLGRIDDLLVQFAVASDPTQAMILMCDLYFTTDYWLKMYKRDSLMEPRRQPAIYALFERVVAELCELFECSINGLPRELELLWGRDLTTDGVYVDVRVNAAEYITRLEAAHYRIWFENGKAYEIAEGKKALADSKRAYLPEAMVQNSLPAVDYGFFVLTMSRDLYMAKHRTYDLVTKRPGFYHSSYVAGSPVQCSGTMLIKNGIISRIRLNSGHYKPHLNNARALIMALRMWGVRMELVLFEDYRGNVLVGDGTASAVIAATDATGALDLGRQDTIYSNAEAFASRRVDRNQQPGSTIPWRNRPMFDPTGKPLPRDYWENTPRAINRHLPA